MHHPKLDALIRRDPRFPLEAYEFVFAALSHTQELLGRPGCISAADGVHCASPLSLAPEELVNLSRTLTVPQAVSLAPTVWVRPRQGPALGELVRQPGTTRADGDSDSFDLLGTAYAAADGDPRTAWTAPQGVVRHRTAPTPCPPSATARTAPEPARQAER